MVHTHDLSEPWEAQRRGPGWLVLLLGVVVFALFGAVVGYAYLRGLPGIGGEPPLIHALEGPYRSAPADPGGLAVPNAKSSIVTVLRPQSEPPRVERLLPVERATPLEAQEPEASDEPPAAARAAPEALAAAPATSSGEDTPDEGYDTAAPAASGLPYPRTRPAPPEPVAEAGPVGPPIAALPQIEPSAAPLAAPVASPPPAPARSAAPGAPQPLVRAPPAATTAASIRPAAGGSVYRLQLAAVRSENGLTQAWADLRQRYPTALSEVVPQVERTDTTSGPLFRLQAGPFVTRESAADACSTIRGSGGQCFIVGPIPQ